jgi:hypothetical protein
MVFRFVANLAKAFVVAILFTAARIASGSLQMPVCPGRDPHTNVRRRDRKRFDAPQFRFIGDGVAIGMKIGKVAATFFSRDTRVTIVEVAQAGFKCRAV